jgi:hypothetical protein
LLKDAAYSAETGGASATGPTQTSPSAGHGNFLPWIGAEFGMSKSTVENFMNVSDAFGNKISIFGNLSASAIYLYMSGLPDPRGALWTEFSFADLRFETNAWLGI